MTSAPYILTALLTVLAGFLTAVLGELLLFAIASTTFDFLHKDRNQENPDDSK